MKPVKTLINSALYKSGDQIDLIESRFGIKTSEILRKQIINNIWIHVNSLRRQVWDEIWRML